MKLFRKTLWEKVDYSKRLGCPKCACEGFRAYSYRNKYQAHIRFICIECGELFEKKN